MSDAIDDELVARDQGGPAGGKVVASIEDRRFIYSVVAALSVAGLECGEILQRVAKSLERDEASSVPSKRRRFAESLAEAFLAAEGDTLLSEIVEAGGLVVTLDETCAFAVKLSELTPPVAVALFGLAARLVEQVKGR